MRITNPQALSLHNDAVKIKEKVKEIELLLEMLFIEDNEIACVPASLQALARENIQTIYNALENQQALLCYFMNNISVKAFKEGKSPENWESALIEELEISDSSIRLLKRHNIFSIKSLVSFLQTRSLTELKGCGDVKADKIEEALVKYLEKQNKESEEDNLEK